MGGDKKQGSSSLLTSDSAEFAIDPGFFQKPEKQAMHTFGLLEKNTFFILFRGPEFLSAVCEECQ